MRQDYSREQLQKIVSHYSGWGKIARTVLFTSGFENTNYLVETEEGKLGVVKIFEGIGVKSEEIFFELEVMRAAFAASLKVPQIFLTTQGQDHVGVGEKVAILMAYVSGDNMSGQTVTNQIVVEVGEQMGKMDTLLKKFGDNGLTRQYYEWDLKNFLAQEKKVAQLPEGLDKRIFTKVFDDFRLINKKFLALPAGLVHNDAGLHNIIVSRGHLAALIDFSDMAFSPYIQNIAVALAQMVFAHNWQPPQARLLINAYQQGNMLAPENYAILYDLILARYVVWCTEFNDWNIRFGQDAQRTAGISDSYNFLQKFINLGRDEFAKLIAL